MQQQSEKIKVSILKVIQSIGDYAGASRISEGLSAMGMSLQPRTVRLYLLNLDREGMTKLVSKRLGRKLTPRGMEELSHANVEEKVGFIAAKVDTLGYRMTFNLRQGTGSIISNVAIINREGLSLAIREMEPVFERRLGMGDRLIIGDPGRKIGGLTVPEDSVALVTVCSVTVNGILLREGIPVTSRFGGLVEVRNGEPIRFVELFEYSGVTVDPLEVFIKAEMTEVRRCAKSGSGIIGASFREIPSVAVDDVMRIKDKMEKFGLGGILAVGKPNRPLLDINVSEGRTGMVVVGGMNPMAAVSEAGIRLSMESLASLEDYGNFMSYSETVERYGKR